MTSSSTLAVRAVAALMLLVGFYLLALVVSGGLLWVPYRGPRYLGRVDLRPAVFCIGGALSVLWSLRPRRDSFVAPGPRLDEQSQPRLLAVIREVSTATQQAMPDEVYAVGQANAFVSQRGGFLTFGSRKIMGLGLPLLAVLTRDELKAVLAHEFGHYHGGDVAIGPLVYRTRATLARTLAAVSRTWVEWPFRAYADLFLRVSSAVSRHQEFVADAVALSVTGPGALATGLRKAHLAGAAFPAYAALEVNPVLSAGWAPPITQGFTGFCGTVPPTVTEAPAMSRDHGDYDSHPPLAERLRAIGVVDATAMLEFDQNCSTLINHLDVIERAAFGIERLDKTPRPIDWDGVVEHALLPAWEAAMTQYKDVLVQVDVAHPPISQTVAVRLANGLKARGEGHVPPDLLVRRITHLIASAITVLLHRQGWTVTTSPGRPVTVSKGDLSIVPLDVVTDIVSGRRTSADWQQFCQTHQLSGPLVLPPTA